MTPGGVRSTGLDGTQEGFSAGIQEIVAKSDTPPPLASLASLSEVGWVSLARLARGVSDFLGPDFYFFPAENICVPKSDPKLGFIDLGAEVKMENWMKKGKLIF